MSRLDARFAGLVLAAATAGCSVPYNMPLPPEQTDACSTTADCGAGAACTGGVCVATQVALTGLELEVIPNSSASYGANTSFLFNLAGKAPLSLNETNTTPFASVFNAALPSPITIKGGRFLVNPAMDVEPGCPMADGSIPGTVTFYPIPTFTGPAVAPVTATTTESNNSYAFDATLVAPGNYDVYFVPDLVKGCNGGQALPPVFIPKYPITAGGAPQWKLPVAVTLDGTITGFVDTVDPVGSTWTADIVEPNRGLSVASPVPVVCAVGVCSVTLALAWDEPTRVPILRLRPPPMSAGDPTIYWSLAGTPLNTGVSAGFSVAGLLVQPVTVKGKVTDPGGVNGVPSTLSIQSTSLSGTVQQNASRSIDGQLTGADGTFSVSLPPGTYEIRASPLDGLLAVTTHTFTVASDMTASSCGCELIALALDPQIAVTGTVTTPLGDPVANAQVGFSPSQIVGTSYWTDTHALNAVASESAKVTTDDAGNFELMVDPGSSNLTVTPDPSSGFPWRVMPDLTVQVAPAPLSIMIQSPALLRGVVSDPGGNPVAGAAVNAWVPMLDASGVPTGAGVQIATTSTGADGSYALLLPPSL